MKTEFVTYEQAVKLKELGFDEPCMFVHDTWGNTKNWTEDGEGEHRNSDKNASIYYSAPLKQQVFRWFREKYGYWSYNKEATKVTCRFYIEKFDEKFFNSGLFGSYEEAESACIDKLIEIVKNK